MRRSVSFFILLLTLGLSSCTSIRYAGVNRIRNYDIVSDEVPEAFDGYRIAFASDFHLKSKFKERQLHGTVKALQADDFSPSAKIKGYHLNFRPEVALKKVLDQKVSFKRIVEA